MVKKFAPPTIDNRPDVDPDAPAEEIFKRPSKSTGPMSVPGYEPLARVLTEAYDQAAKGKGKKRHANDQPFHKQPIMQIARMVGIGGHSYQICKKAQEAKTMADRNDFEAARQEFLGVIVYAAAAFLLIDEMELAYNPDEEEDL